MTISYDKSAAVAVLPAVGGGRLRNRSLRRWLAQANLRRLDAPRELLGRVLEALEMPYPQSGLGALRMWGQTGERPTVWIAAADPVYLEPRLDHLCLHAQDAEAAPAADLRLLIDHLQETLGGDQEYGFARLGTCCYLRARETVATSAVPAYVVHQDMPNAYMPTGDAASRYRSLVSEVEMSLHGHAVNERRAADNRQPINCFWFWGGGHAPQQETVPHPPLFGNDPLLTGYWLSKTATVADWPGNIGACIDGAGPGFVAVAPEQDDAGVLERCLGDLRDLLRSGRLSRLTLMFRDGIEATVDPGHRWRIWRRRSELLEN